ncbi:hypothetical protein [Arthrobacter sp. ES3-54]|uniref:hypothetical protein n=1 Tax=Arthrobacter sp. ES3-54 TaxID=1502991 RepID=UPI0024051578|nr:hypothetical protein [Arthrobacter sp. ES3-54]MDF9748647.1 hypothetical protein [Arthrobacter sp. ES3-54]
MRLYNALVEMIEARAEHIREVTATVALGKYAEGYKDALQDSNDFEIVYIDETEED